MARNRPAIVGQEIVERLAQDSVGGDQRDSAVRSSVGCDSKVHFYTALAVPAMPPRPRAMARDCGRCYVGAMSNAFSLYLVPVAIGAVAVVLVLGLINMMRGGSPNTSQRLMRLRVLLQFVAIIIIMATIWLMGK